MTLVVHHHPNKPDRAYFEDPGAPTTAASLTIDAVTPVGRKPPGSSDSVVALRTLQRPLER
jgi:hypothetical protein